MGYHSRLSGCDSPSFFYLSLWAEKKKTTMIKVGVIGSGSMGTGIAQVAATAGHEVHLYDNNQSALGRSEAFINKIMDRVVE